MKSSLGVLVVTFIVAVCAQRDTVTSTPMDWSATTLAPFGFFYQVVTAKDLLLYTDSSGSVPTAVIRRRNNEGAYVYAANFTNSPPVFFTNGKWIGALTSGVELFSINENNELSNSNIVALNSGFLLSDDTLVGFDPVSELNDGNFTVRTFKYDTVIKNWTQVAGTALVTPFLLTSIADISSYRVYDNHLVIVDPSAAPANISIRIYERQADLSWDLVETVPVNNTQGDLNSAHYNGVDTLAYTVIAAEGNSVGIVFIYTKINGQWVEQKFTTESVGYRPIGYFGFSVAFVDANNIIISAGFENYGAVPEQDINNAGKVLLVTRNSEGLWGPALDLVGQDLFGVGVGVNDYDIIIPSLVFNGTLEVTFNTVPRCLADPINVTCTDQQVANCSDLSIPELYTVNNPQCGGAVTASINGLSLVNNQALSAELTFTRGYGEDVSCTATITCPAPPVAPVADNKNVSGADALHFGSLWALVSVTIIALVLV